jgi:hypothetical protein
MNSLMELFEGGSLEMKVMEKVGCLKYSATQWESDKPDESQRQIHYKFSRRLSPVGGEVTGTQLKSPMPNKKGWIIEEVMELQGVLLGDFFTVCGYTQIFYAQLSEKNKTILILVAKCLRVAQSQRKISASRCIDTKRSLHTRLGLTCT